MATSSARAGTSFSLFAQSRTRLSLLAALALVGAATLWGTSFVASKAVLTEMPPVTVACLRFAIAAMVLAPLACRGRSRPALGPPSMLLGLSGITLFFLFQNAGLQDTSASHATLILGGGLPILTAILGACVLGERPTRGHLVGLACALMGVVAVAGFGLAAEGSLRGNGLLFLAAVSGAVYTILGRRAFAGPNALAVLAGSTLWGALFLMPPALVEVGLTGMPRLSLGAIGLLLYLGLGCSALAFALCAFGLRRLTAAQNGIIGAVELPLGLATATVLLGEVLTPIQLVGGALLLAGAMFAAGGRLPRPGIYWMHGPRRCAIPGFVQP